MQENKSTSNRFHLPLSPSLSLPFSLPLSFFISLSIFLYLPFFHKKHEASKTRNTKQTERAAHMSQTKTPTEEGRWRGSWGGGTSGLAASTGTIVLPQRIFLWLFAGCVIKSSHKALLRASPNKLCCHFRTCLFLAPPTGSPTSSALTPASIQPVVCEKFTQLLQNTAGTKTGAKGSEAERERER